MQSPNNTNTAPGYNSDFVGNEQPQYYGQLYCDPASEQATQATQQNSEAEENNANLSQISPNNLESSQNIDKNSVREQDRFLPIANISRIMKKCLPQNAKISKDAKETAQECISEFIAFVTSEASDRCIQEKRKTISGEDILWAMQNLGFDNQCGPLNDYLQAYRAHLKKNEQSKKPKNSKKGEKDKEIDDEENE